MNTSLDGWRTKALVLGGLLMLATVANSKETVPGGLPPLNLDKDVTVLLDRVSALYRSATGFQVTIQQMLGSNQVGKTQILFSAPGNVFLESSNEGEPSLVYIIGTNAVVHYPVPNLYRKLPAPQKMEMVFDSVGPGLGCLFSANPKAAMLERVSRTQLIGEETINNKLCQGVLFTQEPAPVETWFEKGPQPWLRRIVLSLPQKEGKPMKLTVDYDGWQLNPVVNAKQFVFTPSGIDPRAIEPQSTGEGWQTTVPPIRVPKSSRLGKDVCREQQAWRERVWVKPFKESVKGQPWETNAVAFVEKWLNCWTGATKVSDISAIKKEWTDLYEAGCRTPLVQWLGCTIYYDLLSEPWQSAFGACNEMFTAAEQDLTVPRSLAMYIALTHATMNQQRGIPTTKDHEMTLKWLEAAFKSGEYRPEDIPIFVHQQWFKTLIVEEQPDKLAACYQQLPLPEWAKHALAGRIEVKLAWKERGGDWGSKVTVKGWAGFGDHLQKARTELTQAWKLRPDLPEAAAEMITVVMGGACAPGETERIWFDRAMAAEFDYRPAYTSTLWAYRPRWGGSHELMLAFGKACLDTRRFDTDVPIYFTRACNTICSELEDWQSFYARPEVAKPLIDFSQAIVNEPTRRAERHNRLSYLAINAWLVRDYALAMRTLEQVGPKLHSETLSLLRQYDTSETTMRAQVALLGSPLRTAYEEAEQLYQRGNSEDARSAFATLLEKASPKAKLMLQSRFNVLDIECRLAKGDWVKLTPDKDLTQWEKVSGKWSVEADGTLVIKGDGNKAMLLQQARVGPNFEFRGDYEIKAAQKCCQELVIVFGWQRATPQDSNWSACRAGHSGGSTKWYAMLDDMQHEAEVAPPAKKKFPAQGKFFVSAHNGLITYRIADWVVFDNHKPKEIEFGPANGRIGIRLSRNCAHNTLSLRNLELRRLPSK